MPDDSVAKALEWAATFYVQTLADLARTHPAVVHLRTRGFSEGALQRFRVGFAPDDWHGLGRAARNAGISADVLAEAGLVVPLRDGRGHFDRFRGRITFPLTDLDGRVLGFAARRVSGHPQRTPGLSCRYLNTSATALFQKRTVLFGLAEARASIEQSGTCILVEGYTDALALHQCGISQSVAVGGTVLFEPQVRQLAGLFATGGRRGRALLAFDADEAGRIGTRRALPLLLERAIIPEVVPLPPGRDVADVARRNGRRGLLRLLRLRRSFTSFLLAEAQSRGWMDDPASYADAIRELLELIQRFPDPLLRASCLLRAFAESRVFVPRYASDTPEGEARRLSTWISVMAKSA